MQNSDQQTRSTPRGRAKGRGWDDAAWSVRKEMRRDNVGLVAAGVAFYGFFALFPTLFAAVAIYGLAADPATIDVQVGTLGFLSPSAQSVLATQLQRLASISPAILTWGLVVSLLVALWSASRAARGLMEAMNLAYDEEETRGLFKRTILALLFTIGGVIGLVVAIGLVAAVPAALEAWGIDVEGRVITEIVRWLLLVGLVLFALAAIYRLGPSRESPRWRWVTPGSIVAALLWLAASVGFSLYIDFFASYEETLGSLAGVAILLFWFYLSALLVIVGAEINAVMERRPPRVAGSTPSPPPRDATTLAAPEPSA